ncbi:MAG: GNVR domain-containing protein [bacterium]
MESRSSTQTGSGLLSFFIILSRWKRFIILSVVIITLLSIIVSFLLPKWYASSVTIMPPKNQSTLSMLGLSSSSLMKQLNPLRGIGSLGQSPDIYSYLAILKSRTLLGHVVKAFDLTKVYDTKDGSLDQAMEELLLNTDIRVSEEGTLRIEVFDKDSSRAPKIAAHFIFVLDELNRELTVREARGNREFIERRVEKNVQDLKMAEEQMKSFQKKYGFVGATEQNTAAISAVADLYAKKEAKELEVDMLEKTLGKSNPQFEFSKLQLLQLEKKLKDVPDIGTNYLRLYRDFAVQQRLYETLLPLLEQAKIEEQRDAPTLLVLDQPSYPELPSKPKKKIIVIIFFILALITSIATVFIIEKIMVIERERPDEYQALLKGWLSPFQRGRR